METSLNARFTRTTLFAIKTMRSTVAVVIGMSLLSVSSLAASAGRHESLAFAGSLSVNGLVMVDRQRAVEAQTLFGMTEIETGANSDATVMLRNGSRIHASSDTRLTLDSSEQRLNSSLLAGRLLVSVPAGVFLESRTPNTSINNRSLDEPVTFAVQATESGETKLEVISGQVEACDTGDAHVVNAGKTFSTALAVGGPQMTQNSLNKKQKLGIIFGIGGAVAVLLAVALGNNDSDRQNPGGG